MEFWRQKSLLSGLIIILDSIRREITEQLWEWQGKYHFEAEEIPEQEVYHETVSSTKIRQAISEGYIQRANAYLDHYYIIKGVAENYLSEEATDFPDLMNIPLNEECKILPLSGHICRIGILRFVKLKRYGNNLQEKG